MDGGGEVEVGRGPRVVTEGEFAGWRWWTGEDAFEDANGPFYFHVEPDGSVRCAFRAAARHMNGGGFMHGGCLLTFADFCLFAFSQPLREASGDHDHMVTVSLNGEFIGSAFTGELIEATGGVVKMGGSLGFIRGLVSTADRPLLNFSGVIKRIKRRPQAVAQG